MEYVDSLTGFRLDGRRPTDVRPFDLLLLLLLLIVSMRQIRGEIGVVPKADGSALFEMGNTKVIAAIYGPREVGILLFFIHTYLIHSSNHGLQIVVQNKSQQVNNQALVRCEYSMANFSTGDRARRPKGDRYHASSFTIIFFGILAISCVSQVIYTVFSLGTRSACINAATLALADAGIPMCDIVTSCSAGYLSSTPLLGAQCLQICTRIFFSLYICLIVVLVKFQMDAKLPLDIFENVMQLAIEGCKAIAQYIRGVRDFAMSLMRSVLLENTKQLEYRKGV
ncbi:hypothetical protein BHM03_00000618 [Ensete ventricosum]|nr:hypothetical protein BHM03_00000618 [Ensete ventricosum]